MDTARKHSLRAMDLLYDLELCLLKATAANHDMVDGMFRYDREEVNARKQEIVLQYEDARLHSMIVEDYCAKMAELLGRIQYEVQESRMERV